MAHDHESIEYGLSEVKELYDASILTGIIKSIDSYNDTADVDIVGIGIIENVPIFFHCEGTDTVEGGSMAFEEDDNVYILNERGNPTPSIFDLQIVGFVDGLKGCGFRFKLTREDGVLITEVGELFDYIELYNSVGTLIPIDGPYYEEDDGYWFFRLENKDDRDESGYWVDYTCEDGCITQYEGKITYEEKRNSEDLIQMGQYEDEIPFVPFVNITINGKVPEFTKTLKIVDANDKEYIASSKDAEPGKVYLHCEMVWPVKIYLYYMGGNSKLLFSYFSTPGDEKPPYSSGWHKTSRFGTFDESGVTLDDDGTIQETWTIEFQSPLLPSDPIEDTPSGVFICTGSITGSVGVGNVDDDFSPINPSEGKPYFTIPAGGWGGYWLKYDTVGFSTTPLDKGGHLVAKIAHDGYCKEEWGRSKLVGHFYPELYTPTGDEEFLLSVNMVKYLLHSTFASAPTTINFTTKLIGKLATKDASYDFGGSNCTNCSLVDNAQTWEDDMDSVVYPPWVGGYSNFPNNCQNVSPGGGVYWCGPCRGCQHNYIPSYESCNIVDMGIMTDENGHNPTFGEATIRVEYQGVWADCFQLEITGPHGCGDIEEQLCYSNDGTVSETRIWEFKMLPTPEDRI